jgi:hypothetical protein
VFFLTRYGKMVYGQTAPSASYPDLEGGTHSQAFSAKESAADEAIQEIQTVEGTRKIWPGVSGVAARNKACAGSISSLF